MSHGSPRIYGFHVEPRIPRIHDFWVAPRIPADPDQRPFNPWGTVVNEMVLICGDPWPSIRCDPWLFGIRHSAVGRAGVKGRASARRLQERG